MGLEIAVGRQTIVTSQSVFTAIVMHELLVDVKRSFKADCGCQEKLQLINYINLR